MQLSKTSPFDQAPLPLAKRSPQPKTAQDQPAGDRLDIGNSTLELPAQDVARHRRPVVVIHGTIVHKDSIQAYHDFALAEGHPVVFHDYPTITDGAPIEESAQLVSKDINQARGALAKQNLALLQSSDSKAQRAFFQIDGNLYGKTDPAADRVAAQVPWLMGAVGSLLTLPKDTLDKEFSSRMAQVENNLTGRLADVPGWTPEQRNQVASELVDSLVPKATLVGHSAGGFVAYTVAVNPSQLGKPHDPFSYDGGLGVANVVVLSSPIGKGMTEPTPPAMADTPFYNLDHNVLQPLEDLPMTQLAMLNPFTAFSYALAKSATKLASNVATQMSTGLALPLVYAMKPGYEDVTGSSSFFKSYLKGKDVPDGVTVVAVTSPDDHMSEAVRSHVDDSQPNAHNLSVDLKMAPGEMERERPTWAHVKMSTMPAEFKAQFSQDLLKNPDQAVRFLDRANDDGTRYDVLRLLQEHLKNTPDLLNQAGFSGLKDAIGDVAAERMPFADSPSALAQKILQANQAPG